jgi:hypothetical protein
MRDFKNINCITLNRLLCLNPVCRTLSQPTKNFRDDKNIKKDEQSIQKFNTKEEFE